MNTSSKEYQTLIKRQNNLLTQLTRLTAIVEQSTVAINQLKSDLQEANKEINRLRSMIQTQIISKN